MRKSHDPGQVTHPLDVTKSAAIVGAAAAVPGTAIGAFAGVLRSKTPVLFSIVSGAQWAAIGFTFWGTRTSILNHTGLLNWWNATRGTPLHIRDDLNPSEKDKLRASTISGTFTGISLGLLFRGPRNVIPGAIMFSMFGWGGQHAYNYLDNQNTDKVRQQALDKNSIGIKPKENILQRISKSSWSPMSVLSDDEYEKMMEEKLLRVNAEIAVIDDKIEAIRQKQNEAQKAAPVEEERR